MKSNFIQSLIWIFCLSCFFMYCKKGVEIEENKYVHEKNWIHENGGIYKNENLIIKTESGRLKSGILDWGKVNVFKIGDVNYTEIPFSFSSINSAQGMNNAGDGDVTFSFMIRRFGNKTEASIKFMQKNAKLKGEKGLIYGIIEGYSSLDGTTINMWFKNAANGKVMTMRKQNPTKEVHSNTVGSMLSNSALICDYIVVSTYGFHCWATGGPYNDTACGWLLESVQIFQIGDFGGGGSSWGGGGSIGGPWPPSGGGGGNPAPQTPRTTPCPEDVITNPTVAKSSPMNINGGRFGQTRTDSKTHLPKWHKGLDLFAQPNTPIYAAYGGVVKRATSTFPSTYYASNSFGNFIEIESTLPDGSTIIMLYGHLNSVDANLLILGSTVQAGQQIGLSGRTGNAKRGYSPHVHVQVTKNGQKVNPETYLATKFNSAGNSTGSPCN